MEICIELNLTKYYANKFRNSMLIFMIVIHLQSELIFKFSLKFFFK